MFRRCIKSNIEWRSCGFKPSAIAALGYMPIERERENGKVLWVNQRQTEREDSPIK